ncbi:MAG: adenosylcobinamide-phosphate synthase CbiB [Selenomonadales bacterium]|nr:adenosylcobinamide-phosphate synthase CbiB [Selenomonadales bacterium]MDD6218285.1 adenosylcobinamide-phosphate synthase CbiB [Selenomonadaceae bacterium]
MIVALFAFLVDIVVGDPRSRMHPVVLVGNLISSLEKLLYHEADTDNKKMVKGALLAAFVLVFAYHMAYLLVQLSSQAGNPLLDTMVQALILSFTISPRSLSEAGRELFQLLEDGNLEKARFKVGWIVGRDTDKLSPAEVTRATVETIAENTVDGVIAPLFFFAVGGVPLAVLYRAANTMDSMLGYKNDRYLFFGRVPARLDDILNYIPARICGVLFVLSAMLLGFDYRAAWRIMLRDARKHPSPNGGWAEASVAGALGIRLGGYNSYFGKQHFRAYMGDPLKELQQGNIMECIRLMYSASILFLLGAYILELLLALS